MANSKTSYNYNRKNWEDSDFPILCETCLGKNPYLRMMKDKYGAECKICERPFTSFRWQPGKGARFKKTEVCQTCSKIKNVCQTCLLDLEYGLPVQVRDHALQITEALPKEGANRDYFLQNAERELSQTDGTVAVGAIGKLPDTQNDMLKRMARTTPYYQRNAPHICSFFVKGECKRGEECPYRHEKPTDPDDPLSQQNMKDRYYGTNDPVAEKLLNRAKALPTLQPPEDKNITTLYLGNLGPEGQITKQDLQEHFYQYGDIRSLHVVGAKGCAFLTYTTRQSAELAAERSFNKLNLKGRRVVIRWGIPQAQQNAASSEGRPTLPVPSLPNPCPIPELFGGQAGPSGLSARPGPSAYPLSGEISAKRPRMDTVPMPSGSYAPPSALVVPNIAPPVSAAVAKQAEGEARHGIYYPSQDPQRLGAKGDLVE